MTKNYCACGCGNEIRKESTWAKGHNPNKTKDRFDWSNLKKDYKEMMKIEIVAEKYGCTAAAVSYQLKKQGIQVHRKRPYLKKEIENVIRLYEKYGTVKKAAEASGYNHKTVRERLKEVGYRLNHDNKPLDVEVGIGRYGERLALRLLEDSIDMNERHIQYPYDIEWKGKKIDVKTSTKRKLKYGESYSFRAYNTKCTHYLTISLNGQYELERAMLIPSEDVSGKSISYTIGKESKWDKYIMEGK